MTDSTPGLCFSQCPCKVLASFLAQNKIVIEVAGMVVAVTTWHKYKVTWLVICLKD